MRVPDTVFVEGRAAGFRCAAWAAQGFIFSAFDAGLAGFMGRTDRSGRWRLGERKCRAQRNCGCPDETNHTCHWECSFKSPLRAAYAAHLPARPKTNEASSP